MKRGRKAVSGVIVSVLLITIGILAVVILWNVTRVMLKSSSERAETGFEKVLKEMGYNQIASEYKAPESKGIDVGILGTGGEITVLTETLSCSEVGVYCNRTALTVCHPDYICKVPCIFGDADLNRAVNVGDMGIFGANYGGSGKEWKQGDFNGDGNVNVADVGILGVWYGKTCPVPVTSESYFLKAIISRDLDAGKNRTDIIDISTGNTICSNLENGQTCSMGNIILTVNSITYYSAGERSVVVSINSGGYLGKVGSVVNITSIDQDSYLLAKNGNHNESYLLKAIISRDLDAGKNRTDIIDQSTGDILCSELEEGQACYMGNTILGVDKIVYSISPYQKSATFTILNSGGVLGSVNRAIVNLLLVNATSTMNHNPDRFLAFRYESAPVASTCNDSDGGLNPNKYGWIDFKTDSFESQHNDSCALVSSYDSNGAPSGWQSTDSCLGENCYIEEAFCRIDESGNYFDADADQLIECSYSCVNGACMSKPTENNWCNGADIDRSGAVNTGDMGIYGSNSGRTNCSISNSWCNGADITRNGKVDVGDNGILGSNYGKADCAGSLCTDTDNGLDRFIKGTACEGSLCLTDVCTGNNVQEYYCNRGILSTSILNCTAGCFDGACKSENRYLLVDRCSEISQIVKDKISQIESNGDKVIKVEGERFGRYYDTGYMKNYLVTYSPNSVDKASVFQIISVYREDEYLYHLHLLDTIAQESYLIGLSKDSNGRYVGTFYPGGEGAHYIELFPAVSSRDLKISVTWGEGANYADFGNGLDVFCTNEFCVDYDNGKNYYSKSKAIDELGILKIDTCSNASILKEFYCFNEALFSEEYSCPDGCMDGVCMKKTCTETDGGLNYTWKGNLTSCLGTYCAIKEDFCYSDNKTLWEGDCNSTGYGRNYTCPNSCKDGKCVNCTDSDKGKNYTLKGTTCFGNYCQNDTCSDSKIINEYYCENGLLEDESIVCPIGSCINGRCIKIYSFLSIATLKDSYLTGEVIQLTDPPEANADSFFETEINYTNEQENDNKNIKNYVANEIIVKFKEDPEIKERGFLSRIILRKPKIETKFSSINELNKKNGIEKAEEIIKQDNVYKLKLKDENIERIADDYNESKDVMYAEPNYIAHTQFVPNDNLYSQQWAHKITQAEVGWDTERGNSGVIIAIIDTGVSYNHEDLVDNLWRDSLGNPGKDFVDIDTQSYINEGYQLISEEDYTTIDNDPSDYNGHGTHCAGIAAGKGNNVVGISGVCPNCKIMPVRAGFSIEYLGAVYGSLEYDDIANAIRYATDNGAEIISMSFGGPNSQTVEDAILYAYNHNVTLIAAAGNSNTETKHYPSFYDEVIAVTATDNNDQKTTFSSYGFWTDVAAPGLNILSTVPYVGTISDSSGYKSISGTSMATPYVSGLAGLILSKDSNLNPEEVKQILRKGIDTPNEQNYYIGTGRVNTEKVLQINISSFSRILARINYPQDGEIVNTQTNVGGDVIGESWSVYYGKGLYPDQWFDIGNGPIIDSIVNVDWNTSNIEDGIYTVKLEVYSGDNVEFDLSHIYIDKELKEGWPQSLETELILRSVNIGDLDGDGDKEIVFSQGYRVYAWHHDGSSVEGWPKKIYDGGISRMPAIVDIDYDGRDELFVGGRYRMYAWHGDGTPLEGWPVELSGDVYMEAPSIADIDNDGYFDVIFAGKGVGDNKKIYAFNKDGQAISGWPQQIKVSPYSSPTIGDIDGDGKKEIIFSGANWVDFSKNGGLVYQIYAFKNDGSLMWEWKTDVDVTIMLSEFPVIGDLNSDGKKETVIASVEYVWMDQQHTTYANERKLRIFDYKGDIIQEFFANLSDYKPVSLADVNGDGQVEIIPSPGGWSSWVVSGWSFFEIWNNDGTLFSRPRVWLSNIYPPPSGVVSVGDINNDEIEEFLITGGKYLYALNMNGSFVEGWPKNTYIPSPGAGGARRYSPVITDLENNDKVDIVLGRENKIMVWELNSPFNEEKSSWPMFMHDSTFTGCYDCDNTLAIKPQSKIVNTENFNITSNLLIKIQKQEGEAWQDYQEVYNGEISIPANELLKLDIGKDSLGNQIFDGFNNLNVIINDAGDYRVYVEFLSKNAYWEFKVI